MVFGGSDPRLSLSRTCSIASSESTWNLPIFLVRWGHPRPESGSRSPLVGQARQASEAGSPTRQPDQGLAHRDALARKLL
jgi:hypothetical protein